jgi:Protein of unknown function (DUF1553)/Protein of unknown function (DUF1549)
MPRYLAMSVLSIVLACVPSASAAEPAKAVTAEERAHWAFVPPSRSALPTLKHASWCRNPIDAFILASLEEIELRPAAEAERETLLRRLSFDLTGLPPTPAALDAFLGDTRPDAYDRLVDRLLASPLYGQRWAQHWLDLARYADTDGFEFDQARPDAWRYRDWVVAALNADMPYDVFMRLQLAGDEIAPGDPEATVATGFNRCYPDMVDLNDQGLRRQNALNDITETTGLVFLGLTFGCARCHDHKADPIPQVDYFRLQAFFTPARFRDDLPIVDASLRAEYDHQRTAWDARASEIYDALLRIEEPVRRSLTPGTPSGVDDETAAAFAKPAGERSARDVQLLTDAWMKDKRIKPATWASRLGPKSATRHNDLISMLERLKTEEPKLPQARGLDEEGGAPPPTFVLRRGEYGQRGAVVAPGFPTVLRPESSPAEVAVAPMPRSSGRRRALADWLARPDHPLSARVVVNRLWQHHFGRGLVSTPSDFGTAGEPPSHPELLDWLACELVARNWQLKDLHRLMVTSAAYRQSSVAGAVALKVDPENELLSRFRRVRLDGEAIRDALLAISGRLSASAGGPPVFPALPAELTKLSGKGPAWPVSERAEQRDRRSLYVFVRRNLRYPFFEAFDRPDTNASCPRRSATTIAPQALTLLNSALANEAASSLADRVAREAGPDVDARIRAVFRLAYGRAPRAEESRLGRDFLTRDPSLAHFCLAIVNANEFVYLD